MAQAIQWYSIRYDSWWSLSRKQGGWTPPKCSKLWARLWASMASSQDHPPSNSLHGSQVRLGIQEATEMPRWASQYLGCISRSFDPFQEQYPVLLKTISLPDPSEKLPGTLLKDAMRLPIPPASLLLGCPMKAWSKSSAETPGRAQIQFGTFKAYRMPL